MNEIICETDGCYNFAVKFYMLNYSGNWPKTQFVCEECFEWYKEYRPQDNTRYVPGKKKISFLEVT